MNGNKGKQKVHSTVNVNTAQLPSRDLAGNCAGDLEGDMRARVRAAGPSALSAAAPPSFGARGSGLVVAALLLLLLELGRTGLAGGAASSGGNVQGASGTNTTDCWEAIGAGAEVEEFDLGTSDSGELVDIMSLSREDDFSTLTALAKGNRERTSAMTLSWPL